MWLMPRSNCENGKRWSGMGGGRMSRECGALWGTGLLLCGRVFQQKSDTNWLRILRDYLTIVLCGAWRAWLDGYLLTGDASQEAILVISLGTRPWCFAPGWKQGKWSDSGLILQVMLTRFAAWSHADCKRGEATTLCRRNFSTSVLLTFGAR